MGIMENETCVFQEYESLPYKLELVNFSTPCVLREP